MLKINRIRAISKTEEAQYGFDYKLTEGLNLISSLSNTRGKSSVILAIFYCLGLEEIVGGKGLKTLTYVYKSSVLDENSTPHTVLESEAWLEITNGTDVITIMRAGKNQVRNENLITVFYSNMDSIYASDTFVEDMYVHVGKSATSFKGFYRFLENFIGFDLPYVPASDGNEYKLYMQLLFSAAFIEQKRGWSDLFSAMPIYRIRDAKKRVIEYILAMDTLSNEKTRANLVFRESELSNKWNAIISEIIAMCNREDCKVNFLPMRPTILIKDFFNSISITTIGENSKPIDSKIEELEISMKGLNGLKSKVVDNYDELQKELNITEETIETLEEEMRNLQISLLSEKSATTRLNESLEVIKNDLRNNKDALKLKDMGSALELDSYKGICPICNQKIGDTLLPIQNFSEIMSIEENIKHLKSQEEMLTFSLDAHKKSQSEIEDTIQRNSAKIFTLRKLAKTIRNDLYTVDDNISETLVYKKIHIENRIQALRNLQENVKNKYDELLVVSNKWKEYLKDKELLPKTNLSELDKSKLSTLDKYFKQYLREFDYTSVPDFNSIEISYENYLPTSDGFDMKFDSSASDNIRAIWAYTLALLHTSLEKGGNHPKIILYDEPAQHSIVPADVISLLNAIVNIKGSKQVILGITLNDSEIRKMVTSENKEKICIVDVGKHAFKKLNSKE